MLRTILGALLPMVVTFLLGLMAAWHHDFGQKEASILNRMVLLYAVPLALFAGTVTSSRAELSQDLPLVIALCVGTIAFYGAVHQSHGRASHDSFSRIRYNRERIERE